MTSLDLGWNLDVITQVKKLTENLQLMTVNEVPALPLDLGTTKFVVGPLDIVVDMVVEENLLLLHLFSAGSRQDEQTNWFGRGVVPAEQSELHGTFVQTESVPALAVFLLRIWPLSGRRPRATVA